MLLSDATCLDCALPSPCLTLPPIPPRPTFSANALPAPYEDSRAPALPAPCQPCNCSSSLRGLKLLSFESQRLLHLSRGLFCLFPLTLVRLMCLGPSLLSLRLLSPPPLMSSASTRQDKLRSTDKTERDQNRHDLTLRPVLSRAHHFSRLVCLSLVLLTLPLTTTSLRPRTMRIVYPHRMMRTLHLRLFGLLCLCPLTLFPN